MLIPKTNEAVAITSWFYFVNSSVWFDCAVDAPIRHTRGCCETKYRL